MNDALVVLSRILFMRTLICCTCPICDCEVTLKIMRYS